MKLSVDTIIAEVTPVVPEKVDFEQRDETLFLNEILFFFGIVHTFVHGSQKTDNLIKNCSSSEDVSTEILTKDVKTPVTEN